MNQTILQINDVVKRYASHTALDKVSIDVPTGSIFGLLGPNGAGKTSLIRIINQITGPDEGSIFLNGEKLKPQHTELIGYLPEERGLYKKMEVGEQALYLAQLKGMKKAEAMKRLKVWFEKFEIIPWWKKKVEELSKGMQQKVQFIVTVIHEPPLLILDEPFSGFDPINANLIKDELIGLSKNGSTIILSTHRMESVEELCSHIALINQSKKILEGTVKEVRNTYKSNIFEIEYIGNNIAFANGLWTGFELIETIAHEDHTIARVKLLQNKSTNDLLNAILPHANVLGFKEIIPGMNDIFIRAVQENKQEQSMAK
ncbi:MAG TPA: ATP-binding cassette domain-containing protein [Bacteroidia bacterium]|nr:ATP-binding cassette domain-containing protein [Bacteroidia bacterium]HNT80359.1 ATP-binding cassette domain-containing protein [Bacteroidia bacterium]